MAVVGPGGGGVDVVAGAWGCDALGEGMPLPLNSAMVRRILVWVEWYCYA